MILNITIVHFVICHCWKNNHVMHKQTTVKSCVFVSLGQPEFVLLCSALGPIVLMLRVGLAEGRVWMWGACWMWSVWGCVWMWGVCLDFFWLRGVCGCEKQRLHDSITPRCEADFKYNAHYTVLYVRLYNTYNWTTGHFYYGSFRESWLIKQTFRTCSNGYEGPLSDALT
jgi:hypothetical protein